MDMDIENIEVAILIAVSSLVAALVTGLLTQRGQLRVAKLQDSIRRERDHEMREIELQRLMDKYRQPFARSAYELQCRLYNILNNNFLTYAMTKDNDQLKQYALTSTTYLIGQYFAWREVIRREVQFLDSGSAADTRHMSELDEQISTCFAKFSYGPTCRIFRGFQRAMGEKLITTVNGNCMPICYAQFVEQNDPIFRQWFDPIIEGLAAAGHDRKLIEQRFLSLQHALNDLLDFLDPDCIRFPKQYRTKVSLTECRSDAFIVPPSEDRRKQDRRHATH